MTSGTAFARFFAGAALFGFVLRAALFEAAFPDGDLLDDAALVDDGALVDDAALIDEDFFGFDDALLAGFFEAAFPGDLLDDAALVDEDFFGFGVAGLKAAFTFDAGFAFTRALLRRGRAIAPRYNGSITVRDVRDVSTACYR